jgi:hypothetical protein
MKSVINGFDSKKGDACYVMPTPGRPAVPAGACTLHSGAPAVEQYHPPADNATMSDRVASGVDGTWSASTDGRTLIHTRDHVYTPSPDDPASAVGDFAMSAADAAGTTVTMATADTLQGLWADFADDGKFHAQLSGGVKASAGYGGVSVSAEVPAGGTATVSVVFAWRLPNRLYVGEELGNQYARMTTSAVATAVDVGSNLDEVVSDAAAWNKVIIRTPPPPTHTHAHAPRRTLFSSIQCIRPMIRSDVSTHHE